MRKSSCYRNTAAVMKHAALAVTLFLPAVLPGRQTVRAQEVQPSAAVVVAPRSPDLERYAAEQLCYYLEKLYGIHARPVQEIPSDCQIVLLVGHPKTNPAAAKALGPEGWPSLSDQGLVLKRGQLGGKPVLVVGGGSPRATLWAVYDLVERWGVRYLLHGDVLPADPGTLKLLAEDVVREPIFRVRQWRVVNDFACGPESWGMADYRTVLDQLAKLKFNRVFVSHYPWQPFLHLECRGAARKSATLWYGFKYPISDDMPGRRLFDDRAEFWNPDLPLGAPYEEFHTAGETLIRRLMDHAKDRGMDCVITVNLTDYPAEFQELPGDWEQVHQLGSKSVVPGKNTAPTDPVLTELAATVLRTTVKTYPRTDYLSLGMPEWRQWADLYGTAWKSLDAKYGIEKMKPLADVLAAAERRTGYPGGAERAVREVKGDIVLLYFYDRLLRDLRVLEKTNRPDMPVMYCAVAEELFPILSQILPPGSETLNFVDYTSSRILERQETLAALGGKEIPATLIYTLHDDNVGILPMLTTGSLHKLNIALRKHDWAGFSTRYWLVSDHDPCIAYLARASWDAKATPAEVYADLIEHVCGEKCVADMSEAFRQLEETTVLLEMKLLGVTFPTPGMFAGHMSASPMSTDYVETREGYRRALAAVRRARANTRPAGKAFVDYWIGRLEFGIGYFDCIEAGRKAASLKATGKHAEAVAEMQHAMELSRSMLEAYARVAQDQSDRGAIATMAEYVYRPLKAKSQEWSSE